MKVLISTVAAAMLMSVGAASAACSTSALAGKWTVVAGSSTMCSFDISRAGKITGSCDGPMSGKLALSSKCKLTGTIASMTVTGRTDSNVSLFVSTIDDAFSFLGYRQ